MIDEERLEKMFLSAIYEYKKIQLKYKKKDLVADIETETKEAFKNWAKEWKEIK